MTLRSKLFQYSLFGIKQLRFYKNISQNTDTMTTKALVVVTDGAEEMETVITVDVLRRAEV